MWLKFLVTGPDDHTERTNDRWPCIHLIIYLPFHQGDWKQLGCFKNKSPTNALPVSFDNNVRSVAGPDAIFGYCKGKAEAIGYKMFGADDKDCWSGDDPENTYNKYGDSILCLFSRKTGHGSGQDKNGDVYVYKLEWGNLVENVRT